MSNILVVDDNQQNLYMLQILLSANGFHVEQASNGKEALELAHCSPPDIIISDILMPVMDGFALCRAWKEDELLKNIPFILPPTQSRRMKISHSASEPIGSSENLPNRQDFWL